MNILLAEDDRLTRKLLKRHIESLGYKVYQAADGEEAFGLYQTFDLHLIITDWEMPKQDGLELIRKIRNSPKGDFAYIIILTSKDGTQEIVKGLSGGADDYLVKPSSREELAVRIGAGQRIVKLQLDLAERIRSLEDAVNHIKQLQGILPICMYCKNIRTDKESWQRVEGYISEHSEVKFSHSLCPDCAKKHYPDLFGDQEKS